MNSFLFNKNRKNRGENGFSLLEAIIYIGLFSAIAGVFVAVLGSMVKIGSSESASNELTSQINSTTQSISRLIRQSSAIEMSTSTVPTTMLKLRMKDPVLDPTCVFITGGVIKISQGPNPSQPQNCAATSFDLTTSKVIADKLEFTKTSFSPGRDQVTFVVQLSFNSQNPQAKASRLVRSAVSRVAAATFDDNLIPGSGDVYDVGLYGNKWRSINGLIYFATSSVGIAKQSPSYTLDVNGSFAATSKNFDIQHPIKSGWRLIHSSLEGPEHGVYYRGQSQLANGFTEVALPYYFEALAKKENRTILLTNIDGFDNLAVKTIDGSQITNNVFMVYSDNKNSTQKFNWEVKAERADIPPLIVERQAE